MKNEENVLIVRNVYKSYQNDGLKVEVLKGVSFSVAKGEMVAIMGPSGAGKSTLLNIIGTLEYPDSGEILIGGRNPFKLSDAELAAFRNKEIGFVFQFHHLLPEFSALENVMIPSIIYSDEYSESKKRAIEILCEVGLSERLNHRPNMLSGGERQRVAVARALINDPGLVLADEPTGNLDVENGDRLMELLLKINRDIGTTFIIATHNPEVAERADRIIYLRDGMIIDEK
ncbi:MAG: lipoprotein-releasing system ATP-binding protein LolD [Candidatus Neomarinimicrobiota bacterium]|nr:ABC transporter ATP-binding protein [Candidatus Neomarinimicrobiota bacterium]RKY53800.1 MAG: lipoprotein-releasing system ATP-binding protein LolD [Candidatus Neomarinimicrobiota bacterium]